MGKYDSLLQTRCLPQVQRNMFYCGHCGAIYRKLIALLALDKLVMVLLTLQLLLGQLPATPLDHLLAIIQVCVLNK